MKKDFDQFDTDFKSLIDSYEPQYSEASWKRLDSELPKPKGNFWYYFAASVFLLSILALFIPFTEDNESKAIVEQNFADKNDKIILSQGGQSVKLNNTDLTLNTIAKEDAKILAKNDKVQATAETDILEQTAPELTDLVTKENVLENKNETSDQAHLNEAIITTIDKEPVKVDVNKKQGCLPLAVNATVSNIPANYSVKWILGNEIISKTNHFNYMFETSGQQIVNLEVLDENGGGYYKESINIDAFALPVLDFNMEEVDGFLNVENQSKNYTDLTWNFSGIVTQEENPTFEMLYTDTYVLKLKLKNINGCEAELIKDINYKVNHYVFAPTAFSPDGDGSNDEFMVKYRAKEGYKYTLQVFNASGKKLYESSSKDAAWKGEHIPNNEQTQNPKYLWRLIVEDPRGYAVTKEGVFFQL